jgi:hypothetical protein
MRKWDTRTPEKFPIDLGAGPLFSMTYEVFYFSGFPIDFFGVCEIKAKSRERAEGAKCKIAKPLFAVDQEIACIDDKGVAAILDPCTVDQKSAIRGLFFANRGPCFATREIAAAVRRGPPSGCGFFAHVLSTVLVNNTLNEITIKAEKIKGRMRVCD